MKKLNILLLITGLFILQSCDKVALPEIGGTKVQEMCGEWYLRLLDATDSTQLVAYSLATTSNTAADVADKMWLNDGGHFFGFQSKMDVNISEFTFKSQDIENINYSGPPVAVPTAKPVVKLNVEKSFLSADPLKMTITGGKISKGSYTAPSKAKTDYFDSRITGIYEKYIYFAEKYTIVGTDTSVVWKLKSKELENDGPYILAGYRRTGFLEDEH
jgi:Lipid-binding putative hydrolase